MDYWRDKCWEVQICEGEWPECGERRPVTREGAQEYGTLPEGGESTEGKAEGNAEGKEGGYGEMIDLSGFQRWVSCGKNGLPKHVRSKLQMALATDRWAKGQLYCTPSSQVNAPPLSDIYI